MKTVMRTVAKETRKLITFWKVARTQPQPGAEPGQLQASETMGPKKEVLAACVNIGNTKATPKTAIEIKEERRIPMYLLYAINYKNL
jgi:hypothetical protein